MFRILALLLLPVICLGQVNSNGEKPTGELLSNEISPNEMKRNASFNVDEIKVRWKKAALENCTGVPCVTTPAFTCGTSTVSDIDNNAYNTVLIGTQCWTQSNLKVTKYNDGTVIPDETANTGGWGGLATGARSDYTGEASYIATYGYLYNWYAATDSRKICPTGWHVPTDGEWTSLIQFTVPTETVSATVNGTQSPNAGGKLKSSTLWNTATPQSPGTDNYGFSALPGGVRVNSSFNLIRSYAAFWSTTLQVGSSVNAWSPLLSNVNSSVAREARLKSVGASVRCLRD
jgi:uncharacterized protein (TIGR02145 family)